MSGYVFDYAGTSRMHDEIAAARSGPRNDNEAMKPLSSVMEGRGVFFCGKGDDSLLFKHDHY